MKTSSPERACFHGGAFFEAIGERFEALENRHRVVNADVLDAWFEPAPSVLAALSESLSWLLATSPPTHAEGLVRAIASARGVPECGVLAGAGSSDLVFLALRAWLSPRSRVLLLDPTYGEYAHVCEHVVGCHVDRFVLRRRDGFGVDLDRLASRMAEGYDLVVLVNPNNPSGRHIARADLEDLLGRLPARTRCWVDEAYVDYCGPGHSLEAFAAESRQVVVGKSMSKVYALSGVRAAYLVGPEEIVSALRALSPPWAVGLPAQVAAVRALAATDYYASCYARTHALREGLARDLRAALPGEFLTGVANWVVWFPPSGVGPSVSEIVHRCRVRDVFVREFAGLDRETGADALRVSVKDEATQERIVETLAWAWSGGA